MSSLFRTDTTEPAARPDGATLRALEAYGYRTEKTREWSKARAEATLTARKKEEAIALRRAAAQAATQEEGPPRGSATAPERLTAADFVEETLGSGGPDGVSQAVAYTVYCLTDDETRRLAGYLVRIFRGEGKQ